MPKTDDSVVERYGGVSDLIVYQEIAGHLIFYLRMVKNFRRKAIFVADGHKTQTPSSVTYSTLVSKDSVRICLTISALNDIDIIAADIENAYLLAPCWWKIWLQAGP